MGVIHFSSASTDCSRLSKDDGTDVGASKFDTTTTVASTQTCKVLFINLHQLPMSSLKLLEKVKTTKTQRSKTAYHNRHPIMVSKIL